VSQSSSPPCVAKFQTLFDSLSTSSSPHLHRLARLSPPPSSSQSLLNPALTSILRPQPAFLPLPSANPGIVPHPRPLPTPSPVSVGQFCRFCASRRLVFISTSATSDPLQLASPRFKQNRESRRLHKTLGFSSLPLFLVSWNFSFSSSSPD